MCWTSKSHQRKWSTEDCQLCNGIMADRTAEYSDSKRTVQRSLLNIHSCLMPSPTEMASSSVYQGQNRVRVAWRAWRLTHIAVLTTNLAWCQPYETHLGRQLGVHKSPASNFKGKCVTCALISSGRYIRKPIKAWFYAMSIRLIHSLEKRNYKKAWTYSIPALGLNRKLDFNIRQIFSQVGETRKKFSLVTDSRNNITNFWEF